MMGRSVAYHFLGVYLLELGLQDAAGAVQEAQQATAGVLAVEVVEQPSNDIVATCMHACMHLNLC